MYSEYAPVLLSTMRLSLTEELAAALGDHTRGVLFRWGPESQGYHGDVSEPVAREGRSRSVSSAGRGKLPWDLDACESPQYDHVGCPTVPAALINIWIPLNAPSNELLLFAAPD